MHICPQELAFLAGALVAIRLGWSWIRAWVTTKVTRKNTR